MHKWLGAVVALYFLLMSMTGTSLVFHDELAQWLCPPPTVAIKADRQPFSSVIENSEREFPGYKVTGLIVAHEATHPISVFASNGNGKKITCEVDPYTGKVLGLKNESPVLNFLSDLHFNLLNGKTGRMANGIGATCLFTLIATGLIVWWRGISNWLDGFRMHFKGSLKRVTWNMHSALGVWLLPVLFVWSISGFYFGFPEFFEQNLNVIFPVSSQKKLVEPGDNKTLEERKESKHLRIPIDQFVATALAQSNDRSFVERIAYPDKRRKFVRVWLSKPGDGDVNAPVTQVFLSSNSGNVLAISKSEQPPTGDLIIQTLMKIHFGTIFGTISKSAWLLVGLTPALLSVTGLFLFAHGIANRKEKKEDSRLNL